MEESTILLVLDVEAKIDLSFGRRPIDISVDVAKRGEISFSI
jgi:hypothetical protein